MTFILPKVDEVQSSPESHHNAFLYFRMPGNNSHEDALKVTLLTAGVLLKLSDPVREVSESDTSLQHR